MIDSRKSFQVLVILILPTLLTIITPFIYGTFLGFIYRGDVESVSIGVANAIAYLLVFNHFVILAFLLWLMKRKNITYREIGIKRENITLTTTIIGLVVGLICFSTLNLLPSLFGITEALKKESSNGFIFFIGSITVAPIVEEIVFRGFGISQLNKRFNIYVSILLSAFCFSLLHMYNGLYGLITTFIAGLILGILYMKTRNTYSCICAHFIMNLAIGIYFIMSSVN